MHQYLVMITPIHSPYSSKLPLSLKARDIALAKVSFSMCISTQLTTMDEHFSLELAKFFCKDQIVNTLSFAGQTVCLKYSALS